MRRTDNPTHERKRDMNTNDETRARFEEQTRHPGKFEHEAPYVQNETENDD